MKTILSFVALLALLSLPSLVAQHLPVQNPGFEARLSKWKSWKENRDGVIEISTSVVRDGERSLHLSNMKSRGRMFVFQEVGHVEPETMYELRVWVKADASPLGSVRVGLKLEYYNADGINTAGRNEYASLLAGTDWQEISVVAPTPPDVASVKIYLRLFTQGSVYYDEVRLQEAALVIDQPKRLVHHHGEAVPVRMIVWSPAEEKGKAPEFKLLATHEGKEAKVPAKVSVLGNHRYALEAVLPAITSGFYELGVELGDVSSTQRVRTYLSPQKRKPERLTGDGTILHHGKPFFPIGIYHPQNATYYNMGATGNGVEDARASYALVAAHGFNAIQGNGFADPDQLGDFLDLAHEYGLAVDVPFYAGGQVAKNLDDSLVKIARYRNHPAVLNWKISDEPDIRPEIAGEIPDAYYAMKQADGVTPIEITLATDDALEGWVPFMDIIQIDRYPIPGGKLTAVSDFTRLAVAAKAPWQNVSFVIQCGWSPDLSNQPTGPQARSMVYLALIEGAKGIWWYSMYDPGWDLTRTPLWEKLKTINAEIATLSEPVMLGETVPEVQGDNAAVAQRAFRYSQKLYLLLTNPGESAQVVTFTLPRELHSGKGNTLAGDSFSFESGKVRVELPPLDSRTLVFDLQP